MCSYSVCAGGGIKPAAAMRLSLDRKLNVAHAFGCQDKRYAFIRYNTTLILRVNKERENVLCPEPPQRYLSFWGNSLHLDPDVQYELLCPKPESLHKNSQTYNTTQRSTKNQYSSLDVLPIGGSIRWKRDKLSSVMSVWQPTCKTHTHEQTCHTHEKYITRTHTDKTCSTHTWNTCHTHVIHTQTHTKPM